MSVNLGSAIAYLKLNTQGFDSSLDQSQSKLSKVGAALGKGLAIISGAAVSGLIAVGKASIDTGKEFDSAMSTVAATMGKTTDEIKDLRDFAQEMGAKTAFSATEAAEALNYMALAGYDANTSMEMLPNVLNLAAAGEIELARASDMITDAQTALKLSLSETTDLVDQMAKTASSSNTSVEQLGDAILTIGGTATLMAGGTDRLNTVLGVLADNGIKGSEAGTHLRNMLLKLSSPTKEGAEAIKKLGLDVFDSEGKMRDMQDIVLDLGNAMAGLTDEEKIKNISAIFNSRDIAAVNALLNTSVERWDELGDAIVESTGASQKMAETKLDNLEGDVTLLKSAWEGMKITISDRLTPALRKFVQFGTKEINKLDSAFKKGGIDGLASQLGKSLGSAANMIVEKIPTFLKSAGKLVSSLIKSLIDTLKKSFPKILRAAIDLIGDLAMELPSIIADLLGGIGEIIGEVITNIPNILELAGQIITNLASGIIEGIPKMAVGIWNGIKGLFTEPMSQEVQESIEYLDNLQEKIDGIGMSSDEMYEKLEGAEHDAKMAEYWLGIFEELSIKTSLTKEEQEKLNMAVEYLNGVLPDTAQIVQDETGKWQANTTEIYNNIQAMKDRKIAEIYLEKANGELEKIVELEIEVGKQQEKLDQLTSKKSGLETRLEEIKSKTQPVIDDFNEVIGENEDLNKSWDAGTSRMKEYANSIGIVESNFSSWNLIAGGAQSQQAMLQSEIDATDKSIEIQTNKIEDMEGQVGSLEKAVDDYMNKSAEWRTRSEKDIDAVEEKWRNRSSKIKGYINGVTGAFNRASMTTAGAYATGLDYVPRTMDVTVHRGERILTQEENKKYNEGGSIQVTTYENDAAILSLGSKLDAILEAIDKIDDLQMVIDGKKLVGSIKREVNRQLGNDFVLA